MNLKNQEEFLELILKNGLSPEIQVAVLLENLDTVFDKELFNFGALLLNLFCKNKELFWIIRDFAKNMLFLW